MATTLSTGTILDIDSAAFGECFDRRAFAVRHRLAEHPLLTLDALAELSDVLPRKSVERHRADLDLLTPGGAPDLDGRPSDTVRELETGNVWMVLWYIEQVPEYRQLLDDCLDEVERLVRAQHGPMRQRKGYIFLSAPNATTPVHFDPEQNLLLQIRGVKEMNLGRFDDPADHQAELDRYFDGGHRNLDRMPRHEDTFRMAPGDGVYVYPFAPHWVKNGPQASVSLSITFRTAASQRMEHVNHVNARLRRLHLHPRPQGVSPAVDRVKATVMAGAERVKRHQGDTEHGEPGS